MAISADGMCFSWALAREKGVLSVMYVCLYVCYVMMCYVMFCFVLLCYVCMCVKFYV